MAKKRRKYKRRKQKDNIDLKTIGTINIEIKITDIHILLSFTSKQYTNIIIIDIKTAKKEPNVSFLINTNNSII